MKIKSLTKLAMSGVALAAVAATLGTSTYAWYVINPIANVTNITASTETNEGSSILVSKDNINFSGKVAFANTDFADNNDFGNHRAAFMPVTTQDGRTFYDMDNYAKVVDEDESTTAETSATYLQFSVWVKSGSAGNVQVKLSASNTTESLPTQYSYQDVGAKAAGQNFTVDAVQALRTSVVIDASTTTTIYDTQKIAYQSNYEDKYAPIGDVKDTNKKSGTTVLIGAEDDGSDVTTDTLSGAHLYYAQVMNELPASTTDGTTISSNNEIANVTIATANVAVRLTFRIWLEGGDDLCFDACGGQDFEFGLQFMSAQTSNANNGD